MSINAKGEAFYCDYGTSVVSVRCGSDHAVVEEFNLNDSGKFLAEKMCKLLNREADALKAQIEERDSSIRLWSARADELRKRCDYWYKLGKTVEKQESKPVPRKMTLESSVEKAKALYAQRYGADSWQWRDEWLTDEWLTFAVGDFLSSCEMTESDWDYAKREGIVAEVNWWLNQQEEGR